MSTNPASFCTNCGAALTPNAAFCEQCGQPLAPAVAAPPVPVVAAPAAAAPVVPPRSKSGCGSCFFFVVLFVLGIIAAGVVYREQIMSAIATLKKSIPDSPASTVVANPAPPVEVAYIHFLDEAHRRLGGQLQVGSPVQTSKRIEVSVTTKGKTERLVVIEKSNDGRNATILVGPKDAGAVRSYGLERAPDGWTIKSIQDLDG
ncbi:MAG: zinc ribbon domain-containing protein [Verrucomicrobiaceae bacterium]|nr:zinc ribbon domain-containing protein [Verrucomicrobiaceae bacterium]